jgi:hypothetical protein
VSQHYGDISHGEYWDFFNRSFFPLFDSSIEALMLNFNHTEFPEWNLSNDDPTGPGRRWNVQSVKFLSTGLRTTLNKYIF